MRSDYKMNLKCFLLLIFISFISTNVSDIQLKGRCGFPGRPYRAHLEQDNKVVSVDKLEFDEGEEVTIVCKDFWPPPQKRKCVRGTWSGYPPRCGDFIYGFQMKDSKVENISNPKHPILMFEHLDMNFTQGSTSNLNAFTTMQFKKARLRVYDSNKYKWTFNFTAPAVKLFVRTNFVFVNYTLLPKELKNNFTFNISVKVSPYRDCVLRHQKAYKDNMWATNGLKMECHFICDSVSPEGWKRDIENPGNYLLVETQSSIDIPYDIITIYFGRSYNTEENPVCGEPEFPLGQYSQSNVENKNYRIDCNIDKFKYISSTNNSISEKSKHEFKCSADMKWNGTYPLCVPKKPCSIDNLNENNETIITSIDGLIFFNDTYYKAIDGTEVKYGCVDSNNIFLNENSTKRLCLETGLWSGAQPQCYNQNKSLKLSVWLLIGILFTALLIICLTGILFYFYTKHIRNRMREQIESHNRDENYDDIDIFGYKAFEVENNGNTKSSDTYYALNQEYEELKGNSDYNCITPNSQYVVMKSPLPMS